MRSTPASRATRPALTTCSCTRRPAAWSTLEPRGRPSWCCARPPAASRSRWSVPGRPRVAVVGAGGIGVDVSEFLTHDRSPALDVAEWMAEWGVTDPANARAGLEPRRLIAPARRVYLLQRKKTPIGKDLGKTSG